MTSPRSHKGLGVCEESSAAHVGTAASNGGFVTWPPSQREAEARHLAAGSGNAREAS